MKTWLSFLLPADEYKEKKMLYFLSEGGLILFLSLIVFWIINKFAINIEVETILLSSMGIFILYMSVRYIISSIEYTDIHTETAYKKELRVILIRVIVFLITFVPIYLVFIEMPTSMEKWFELLGLILGVSFVWFLASYTSLKRSYSKNKKLL
jgi:hypothetical protein